MKIFLLGYMGSGKSFVGKQLSNKLGCEFLDLDHEIEKNEAASISEIFEKKGEIFFRKLERKMLENLISYSKPAVVALGGGTPCYGDNMDLIKESQDLSSIYLKLNIDTLTERLWKEKHQRPLISHLNDREALEEFIRKHLFERSFYYNQSQHVIDCNSKTAGKIIDEIEEKLK